MMLGLGDAHGDIAPTTFVDGFSAGLMNWKSPSAALTQAGSLISHPSTAFANSATTGFTVGVLAVPLAALAFLFSMSGGNGRR